MNNNQLLKDKNIFPDSEVLKNSLWEIYKIYEKFENELEKEGLELNWRYYNDGKAWLWKANYKWKTVFWLSVWEWYFKTSFHFTEKNEVWIKDLDISEKLKENYFKGKFTGKLRAFIIDIFDEKRLNDIFQLIKYKKWVK